MCAGHLFDAFKIPKLQLPAAMDQAHALVAIAGAAVITHLVFKRWEPTNIGILALLLLALPMGLSTLLLPHYGPLLAPLVALAAFHAAMLASIALYRVSPWHPLANYPGPLLAKLSKWWLVWKERHGKQHLYIQELHEQYGDVVRIGPNDISIRDVEAIVPLMGLKGLPKGPAPWGAPIEPSVVPLIGIRDNAEHARRRRPWARAFAAEALKGYEPMLTRRLAQLVDKLGSQQGAVDLSIWLSYFSHDFMGDMIYGGGHELLANGDANGIWAMFRAAAEGQMMAHHLPWLTTFTSLLPASPGLQKMRSVALRRTMARYANGSDKKDLFHYLSNEDNAEKISPPPEQLVTETVLAVFTSSETVAMILSNVFWQLLQHPQYYKQLQTEVDRYYPAGENAYDTKNYDKMVWLDAVLNEALRLYPITPSGSQRAPAPGRGDRIVGPYVIPEGTNARVHTWSLHRDPRYFANPNAFWPERWLVAGGHASAPAGEGFVHDARAFVPYSVGPMGCVGRDLAELEMRMVLCALVQKLQFAPAEGWDPAERERTLRDEFVVCMRGPVSVVVSKRT
ncbi:cytochrome P450 [Phanerochaete sordida]|uniref:Cytochrome P450 n=1 Tax=Phanerochaete sordida TaxID=48140 RepID=A0A9P3GJI4_9APHY|nr:cytochrome P450 [Phanerochaete sordida]